MSLTQSLIQEIKHESASTRKMLERVPADKFDWRPHEKSMSLKSLATHVADLAGMTGIAASKDYLDFMEDNGAKPQINSTEDLVAHFDALNNNTIEILKELKDEDLNKEWTMRAGDHIIMQAPKKVAIRSMGLNHLYHHRAQLGVYLRLLDIPIPGMYGPSADEK